MSGSHLSKDFFEFIKAIGESRSKQVRRSAMPHRLGSLRTYSCAHAPSRWCAQEEDTIVVAEVARLKQKMQEPGAAKVRRAACAPQPRHDDTIVGSFGHSA